MINFESFMILNCTLSMHNRMDNIQFLLNERIFPQPIQDTIIKRTHPQLVRIITKPLIHHDTHIVMAANLTSKLDTWNKRN